MDALETHEYNMNCDIDKMSEDELKKVVKGLRGHVEALNNAMKGKRELENENLRFNSELSDRGATITALELLKKRLEGDKNKLCEIEQELRRKLEVAEEEIRQLRRQIEEDRAKHGKNNMNGSGGSTSKALEEMKKENANLKQIVGNLELKNLELKEKLKQRTSDLEAMKAIVKREGSKNAERLQELCGSEEGGEEPGGEVTKEGDGLEGRAQIVVNPTTIQSVKSEMMEDEEDESEDSENQDDDSGQQVGEVAADIAVGDGEDQDESSKGDDVQEPEKGSGEDGGGCGDSPQGEEEEDVEDEEEDAEDEEEDVEDEEEAVEDEEDDTSETDEEDIDNEVNNQPRVVVLPPTTTSQNQGEEPSDSEDESVIMPVLSPQLPRTSSRKRKLRSPVAEFLSGSRKSKRDNSESDEPERVTKRGRPAGKTPRRSGSHPIKSPRIRRTSPLRQPRRLPTIDASEEMMAIAMKICDQSLYATRTNRPRRKPRQGSKSGGGGEEGLKETSQVSTSEPERTSGGGEGDEVQGRAVTLSVAESPEPKSRSSVVTRAVAQTLNG